MDCRDACILVPFPEDLQFAFVEEAPEQIAVREPCRRKRGHEILAGNDLCMYRESE